jgi:hypothetical protein
MPDSPNSTPDFRTVFSGNAPIGAVTPPPGLSVIRDEQEWSAQWKAVTAGRQPPPERPAVDFQRETLIVYAAGQRPSGGYKVKIQTLTVREGKLHVAVVEQPPTGFATAVLTSPIHVVAADLSSLPSTVDPALHITTP